MQIGDLDANKRTQQDREEIAMVWYAIGLRNERETRQL